MFWFESKIRYSEVDAECKLTIPALINYFQDCTSFHSESVGDGVQAMRKRNQAWILSFYQICINELPKYLDEVIVQTYPYEIKGFYGMRNFLMKDKNEKVYAYANSIWVLMDVSTGRPAKASDEMIAAYGQDERLDMDYCKRKLSVPLEMTLGERMVVPSYFIDSNHHMNNEKYIMLATECLPKDFKVEELRVEYKKEAKLSDVIIPGIFREDNRIIVTLMDENSHPYAIIMFIGSRTDRPER